MGKTVTRLLAALVVAVIGSIVPVRTGALPLSLAAILPDGATRASAVGGPVFVVGDSLTFLAEPEMSSAFLTEGWSASVLDSFQGRGVDFTLQHDPATGLQAVDALRERSGDNIDWIVALGTNEVLFRDPSTFPGAIRRMLDRIGRGHRVMWVNAYLPDHPVQQAMWNVALDHAAAERDGEVVVFDWATLSAQHPEWMLYDNVHHNIEGNIAWASAIAKASRALLLPAQPTTSAAPPIEADSEPGGFVPVGPARLLDTREGAIGATAAMSTTRLDLGAWVPPDTSAVAINLTVTGYSRSGYATAFPCAAGVPDTSTVNYEGIGGPPQSTSTIVRIDSAGELCVFTNSATHIVIDVFGAFVVGQGLPMAASEPTRLIDTRATSAPVLAAGSVLRVPLPAATRAVIVNLTVDRIGGDGYVTAWPCTQPQPHVSNLNYAVAERQKANVAVVPIGADGTMCIFNSAPTAVIVDLLAVFAPGLPFRFHATEPTRVLDTRTGDGGWIGRLVPRQVLTVGPIGPQPGAVIVASVTVTDTVAAGFVTAWSGSGPVSATSAVNFVHGSTRPNMVVIATAADGMFRLIEGHAGRTDVIVDITGWFAP